MDTPTASGNRRKAKPRGKPFQKGNSVGKQYEAGVSGNPTGRPKAIFADAYRKVLERAPKLIEENKISISPEPGDTYADLIAKRVAHSALSGELNAVSELRETVDGKTKERKEISGPEGGPIKTITIDYSKLKKNVAAAYELSEAAEE